MPGSNKTIISRGRAVSVTDLELEELRSKVGVTGWHRYCHLRLTMGHAQAIQAIR